MTQSNGNVQGRPYEDAYELVASILRCRKEDLTSESSLKTTPGWDSMVQVEIMIVLSDVFGIEITDDTIASFSRLASIEELMKSRS